MDPNLSSCWDSILERVKPHIPTIDSDSSSSDNEETVTIFQRPAGLSLKVPEDFDSFSVDDEEELLKPAAETCWSEETCTQIVKLDADEIIEATSATQSTQQSDADVEAGAFREDDVELNRAKVVDSVTPSVDKTETEEGFPLLSFARVAQWDLDVVLQNLQEGRLSLQEHVTPEPAETHADGDKNRSQPDIMERLVAFYNRQSVPALLKNSEQNRQNNMWNKSSIRMAAELQQSHQECPTVYIDLRCPDASIKPLGTSPNLSAESKSPAKHNSHQETPPAKKHNLNVHIGSQMGDREATGKSVLLQKMREMKRNGIKHSNTYKDPYLVPANGAEEQKVKLPKPVESTGSHELHHPSGDKQSSHVQFEHRNPPKMEKPPKPKHSTINVPGHQSDQQRERVKQTLTPEQHQTILKQLEKCRPTKSVNQKQPAAEKTEVLYDFDASHLQSISSLPADIDSKGCVLLIVSLSSPGMIGDKAHSRGRKHLYPAATKSHVYNTLVAWFLSLVGPDPHPDEDEAGAEVPFWVAGLQQLWTEKGLALHVLVVAHHSHTLRKGDTDIQAPFYKQVWRFLSETSLSSIAERTSSLDQQASTSSVDLPSSSLKCFISATSKREVIERTFGFGPGFYWQTVETQECDCEGRGTTSELHTEVSVALVCKDVFLNPLITHSTLRRVLDSGLDVCGLRLLYPPQGLLTDSAGPVPVLQRTDETCQPVLALAVRGPHAHSLLRGLNSSLEPLLPRETDPTSLNPPHGRRRPLSLLYSPRLATQVHRELCLWFSGRFQKGIAQNHNQPLVRVLPSEDSLFHSSRSPSSLCATTQADLLLVVSPVVPPCCYGQVLAVCVSRGFGLRGLQKLQLRRDGAAVLRLTDKQAHVFCGLHNVTPYQEEPEPPSHCLVLLLRKENAMLHSIGLPAALMREFEAQKPLGCICSRLNSVHTVEPNLCFHTVSYRRNQHNMLVRCMWDVPHPSNVILSHRKHLSNSKMEQVVILTLCGKDLSQGLSLLHRVLTEGPEGDVTCAGFELLSMKYLPVLTRLQAQELNPYEVGEQLCHDSLNTLMSSPALLCALRRVDAFDALRKLLPQDYPGNLSVLMSLTPEVAFRQVSLFFFEHEMIPDPQMLLTVCVVKSRIWRHTLGKIVHQLQLSDFTLVGLRLLTPDRSNVTPLPPAESDPSNSKAHVEYLCPGSSLVLCLEGKNAVNGLLDVVGQENPTPRTSCYDKDLSHSGIYASGSYQKAIEDVKKFFPEGLCCIQTSTMRQVQIPSMCSDPVASVEREQNCTLAPVTQENLSPSMTSGPNAGSVIHSALWQTTCLLIPCNTPPLSQVPSQLDMLEQLLRLGCHLVAGKMTTLDDEQRTHIANILMPLRGNERMAHLSTAPCLIMALQGKTIVTCFASILERIFKERSDLETVGKMIIYAESEKEAEQLICYLFEALSPESHHAIVP